MATTYDKASLVMIPSGYKDDKLYSVKPTDGSGDFTFSRDGAGASPATRVNASGLIEKGRENLLIQSNSFTTGWGLSNVTMTGGQAGYDGSNDAWLMTDTNSGAYGTIDNLVTTGGITTFSCYAKSGTTDIVGLRPIGGSSPYVFFDLSNGTFEAAGDTANLIDWDIQDAGGGWYRCSVTTSATATQVFIYIATTGGALAPAGSTLYIQDAQVESGLVATDYIETTTAPVSAGLLGDMPRLDYSGGATCPSLLLEPSRVNLFEQSEYFSSTYWAKTANGSGIAPVVTQNYATSPEGVQNASRVQFDTNGSSSGDRSGLVRDFAFTTGDKYAISCWVKSASGSDEIFTFRIAGAQVGGEKIATSEWQLFTETHTATATTTDNFGIQIRGNYSSQTSDILIYGMQLESGVSYPTSYIPTYGSASGRAVDKLYKTGIADLIGQTEGTIFIETTPLDDITTYTERIIQFEDGGSDLIGLQRFSNSTMTYFGVTSGGTQWSIQASNVFEGGRKTRIAAAYANNDIVLYVDGVQKGTDSSASVPTTDRVNFANNPSGSLLYIGEHHQVLFFPTRLTNAELAALTTI